jgi:hypothetical protein
MNPMKDQLDKPENERWLEPVLFGLTRSGQANIRIAISFLSFLAHSSCHASSHPFRRNVRLGPVAFPLRIDSTSPSTIPISTSRPHRHRSFSVIDRNCCRVQPESFENISAHSLTVGSFETSAAVERWETGIVCDANDVECLH